MSDTEDVQGDLRAGTSLEESRQEKTLPAIIKKMRGIAQEQFNGRIYDNIYGIFMQLTVHEKRMLLKGIINILLIVEDKTNNGTLVSEAYVETTNLGAVKQTVLDAEQHITSNLSDIEEFNKVEMIKLRSKITIIVVIFALLSLFGMMMVAIYLSQSKTETLSMFTEFGKIIAEMLGI